MKKKTRKNIKFNSKEWDYSKSVEVDPEPRKKNELSTSIRLPLPMVNKLRKVAKQKGDIGYQTLIKIWIAERLDDEEAA